MENNTLVVGQYYINKRLRNTITVKYTMFSIK